MKGFFASMAAICAILLTTVDAPALAVERRQITIGTGSVKGLYFPLAVAVCRVVNRNIALYGHRCSVRATAGSVDNVRGLREGRFNFALVQSDVILAETEDRSTVPDILSVVPMHYEPVHLLVGAESGIGRLEEFGQRSVGFGDADSGSRTIAAMIRDSGSGAFLSDVGDVDLTVGLQADALCAGRVDALFWVSGVGNRAARDAVRNCGARLLSFPAAVINELVSAKRGVYPIEIPAGTYRINQPTVATLGPRAILAAHRDTPADLVADLVAMLARAQVELRDFHPALREFSVEVDGNIAGMDAHPGVTGGGKVKN